MPEWMGPRQKQSAVVFILLIAGMWYMNSRGKSDSPEQQVRKLVEDMTKAAEEKDLDYFREKIAEGFEDNHGNQKKDAIDLLRGFFFTQEKIRISIISLDVKATRQPTLVSANLSLFFSESILPQDKGEFLLLFRNEQGTWRLASAEYQQEPQQ